ncbi:hypothetical protein BGZ60DRAFT_531679 [Tricladium varicosporioides]|nr:hypothetical protein BGZ60DRAFT_531679 [Hymenoscyphus varicosporioides]
MPTKILTIPIPPESLLPPVITALSILLFLVFTIATIRSLNSHYHSRKIQKAQYQRADLEAACAFVLANEETPLLARMGCSDGAAGRRDQEQVEREAMEERERRRRLVWRCLVVRSAVEL